MHGCGEGRRSGALQPRGVRRRPRRAPALAGGAGRRGSGPSLYDLLPRLRAGRVRGKRAATARPKLRPIRQAIPGLTCCFAGSAGWRSGYFKVSGIGAPMNSKACRWALVGSVSIAMVTWVPVYRTWLRVKVARCSSRPRKLRPRPRHRPGPPVLPACRGDLQRDDQAAGPPRRHRPGPARRRARLDAARPAPLRAHPRRRERRQHRHPARLLRPRLRRQPRPLHPRLARRPHPLAGPP